MSPPIDDVIKLCCELSANQQIKTTVKHSGKGAMTAGGLAFAGGLVGGPLGIAVGKYQQTALIKILKKEQKLNEACCYRKTIHNCEVERIGEERCGVVRCGAERSLVV